MRRETVDDMTALSASVDFINLVSWDLAGYWSGFAGFGNALNSSSIGEYTLVIISMVLFMCYLRIVLSANL